MKDTSTNKNRLEGICLTCKNNSSCIYIKNGKGPVQYCEEFEVYSYRPVIENIPIFRRTPKEEKPALKGICKNCDNRKDCMNAKPERIIWHCEEYV